MNTNTNKISDSAVEKLIAESTVEASIVQAAAEKNATAQREAKIAMAQKALDNVNSQVNSVVEALRQARKAERTAKDRVVALATAAEAFKKTGNLRAFAEALYPNDRSSVDYYLRNYPGLSN